MAIETCISILDEGSTTIKRNGTEIPVVEMNQVRNALQTLDAIVVEQIFTAEDAKKDWRDIVPDEVAKIEQEAADTRRQGG